MKASIKRFLRTVDKMLTCLHNALHSLTLLFFKNVNRKIESRLPVWRMKIETSEHIRLTVKVFKMIILPASFLYVSADLYFLGRNALDSMLWGLLIFFYSSFLPDFPSIFRRKKSNGKNKDLPWYKKYALLLLAPVIIWLLFSGSQLAWKTSETFHNFKSLTVYGASLLLLGFLLFANSPLSVGHLTEILSLSLYGVAGYLTHLKVDKIW
jgi:hypothetical protein